MKVWGLTPEVMIVPAYPSNAESFYNERWSIGVNHVQYDLPVDDSWTRQVINERCLSLPHLYDCRSKCGEATCCEELFANCFDPQHWMMIQLGLVPRQASGSADKSNDRLP